LVAEGIIVVVRKGKSSKYRLADKEAVKKFLRGLV